MSFNRFAVYAFGIAFLLYSCVDQDLEECPVPPAESKPLIIRDKDKNYSNISSIEGLVPLDEDQPFISFINPLYLLCLDAGQDMVGVWPQALDNTSREYIPDISFIPPGRHRLGAVGNMIIPSRTHNYDMAFELHPENNESLDFFVGYHEADFPLEEEHIMYMYRVKGKLIAIFDNLPENIGKIRISADNVSKMVNRDLVYTEETNVAKSFNVNRTDAHTQYSMFIAPSNTSNNTRGVSPFVIEFFDNGNNLISTVSNIDLSIKRNTITVIRTTYIPEEEGWTLESCVDGTWEQIHQLHVENRPL